MFQIQQKFIKYNYSSRSQKPSYIVIHDTQNPGGTALNHYNYFNDANRNASADFFVDSTSIIQLVNSDVNCSWQCGDGHGAYGITNSNSLGIEMCLEKDRNPSDVTVQQTIELTVYLMEKYNIPLNRVVRHYDASRKSCPLSFMSNNWARWNDFKSKLSGQPISTPNPSPTPQPTVDTVFEKAKAYNAAKCKELQEKLNKCGYNCGAVDGVYGQLTHTALGNFQAANGLTKDFLAGTQTFAKLDEIIAKQNSATQVPVTSAKYNEKVKEIQTICNKYGMNIKVDGIYGLETENAIKKLPLAGLPYKTPELTKWIQKIVGCTQDGIFGATTDKKVKEYQSKNKLKVDGLVGFSSIKTMLGL